MSSGNDPDIPDRSAMVFLGLGFEVVGFVVAGFFIGQVIDEKYALQGIGTLACVLVALLAFIVHVVYYFNKISKPS